MDDQSGIMLVGFLGGGFSLAGAIFDWDWLINSRQARFFVSIFGRTGARIFYGGLGIFLIGISLFAMASGG